MGKIITCHFSDDFICFLGDYILKNFSSDLPDLSRLAVVFGGRRPALFLKRQLSRAIKSAYLAPTCFSMDEFVTYIYRKDNRNSRLCMDLDAAYFIYTLAKDIAPAVLGGRDGFADFLPWASQIVSFFDELDLENIEDAQLEKVKAMATVGYDVPENINHLLRQLAQIRKKYQELLLSRNLYSRGMLYRQAAVKVKEYSFEEFKAFVFCNFYYLSRSEEEIVRYLFHQDKAILLLQVDDKNWPALEKFVAGLAEKPVLPLVRQEAKKEIKIYGGFDTTSQVGLARYIIKEELSLDPSSLEQTLILLPASETLVPILSEIAGEIKDFNVSMGYPLTRTPLYSLLKCIFSVQGSRRQDRYYSRDYLKVILHPLIKNLCLAKDKAVTRVLMHKIEEVLLGIEKTQLSGSLFIQLGQLEDNPDLYRLAMDTLLNMQMDVAISDLQQILKEVHRICFRVWEEIETIAQVMQAWEDFAGLILEKSTSPYPLNVKAGEKISQIMRELGNVSFGQVYFRSEDLFKIIDHKLCSEKISFSGSPLKGLQVLGLLETRALSFKNIIVLDMNEGVLPSLDIREALIPQQVLETLGLARLKQEEEIQRYHFMRLIGGAQRLYFIYDNNPEKEKSRFLEEIIWEAQKRAGTSKQAPAIFEGCFSVGILDAEKDYMVNKTPQIISYLKEEFEYSASSIDEYLTCPLRFYYRYVLGLREKDNLLDEPEGRDIGNFLHNFLKHAFAPFLGKPPRIDADYKEWFLQEFERLFQQELQERLGAEAFMVKEIMSQRLGRFLENEAKRPVKSILSLEDNQKSQIIQLAGNNFKIAYRIDRVDMLDDGSILVLDYKSGKATLPAADLSKLEEEDLTREIIKKVMKSFQLPLYVYFTRRQYPGVFINAALYNLMNAQLDYFIDKKTQGLWEKKIEISLRAMEAILKEIIAAEVCFVADRENKRICDNCPFLLMCS